MKSPLVPIEAVAQRISLIRGQKIILDSNLAKIYGVSTARLNQQVKRNIHRFPGDFMLQLTKTEFDSLMLQNATSKKVRGGRRKHPFAFTEHGAIMAANVLKSERAVRMSVYVVRAFVRLRETFATHKELAQKFAELERKVGRHDGDIQMIVKAIRRLMTPPKKPKREMGFIMEEPRAPYGIRRIKRVKN